MTNLPARIELDVACALPEKQLLSKISVDAGTTARDALLNSGLQPEFPEVDFAACPLGIWGKPVDDDYRLLDGDRLEVYRPLLIDPREARRQLAQEGRSMGKLPER